MPSIAIYPDDDEKKNVNISSKPTQQILPNTAQLSNNQTIGVSSLIGLFICCFCLIILIGVISSSFMQYQEVKSIGRGDYKSALMLEMMNRR